MNDIKELYKNCLDPYWRLTNLYSIIDKQGNKLPFKENIVQQRINKSKSFRKMVLKARQFGVSTNELIKLLDWVLFNENATAAIIAHKQDAIEKLFRIPKIAYELLPDQLKPQLDRGGGSKYEMYFPQINSRIYCDLEVRGGTVGRLHVSEAAFMKDSSRLKATLQAVPLQSGRVTIETTPNGMANFFYDMWTDPDSIYEKMFFPWYIFPEYKINTKDFEYTEEEQTLTEKAKKLYNIDLTKEQISYRRFKKSEMKLSSFDKKKVPFEQEYPEDDRSCFLTSGDAVIDLYKINDMIVNSFNCIENINGIKIYRKPIKGKIYICGADPAEGVGKDESAAVILDVEDLEIVAVYNGQLKPSDFALKLIEMCNMYSSPGSTPPLLAVERNNHGHAVLLKLDIESYANIYVSEKDKRPGFRSDSISRPLMIDKFVDAVEMDYLKIYDKDILSECLTLINNDGKIEAATGKHDDLIIACAISLQVKPDLHFSNQNIEDLIKL